MHWQKRWGNPQLRIAKIPCETGEKIHNYLNTLRLRKACERLLHSEASVREIATCVGFSDVTWFISAFKKELARRRCSTGRTMLTDERRERPACFNRSSSPALTHDETR